MHKCVVREGWVKSTRLPSISPDCLHTDAQDIPFLCQKLRALLLKTGRVCSICLHIEELISPLSFAPARSQQYPRTDRNAPIGLFPGLDMLNRQQKICRLLHIGGNLDHACWTYELARFYRIGCIIGQIFPGNPVDRRVEVCSRMLSHVDHVPVPARTMLIIA